MIKAKSLLKNIPKISENQKLDIQKFVHLALLTFSFAPDREEVQEFQSPIIDDISFLKMSAEIVPVIRKKFFDDMYTDRIERIRIEGYIPTGRLILIHGLSGVGKTVLVLKICQNLNKSTSNRCIYFDLKSFDDQFMKSSNEDFIANFHTIIYHSLTQKYIDNSKEQINNWLTYRIINDSKYTELKEKILDIWRKPLSSSEWLKLLDRPEINKLLLSINNTPSLSNLLIYFKQTHKIVLCLDNADKFTFNEQRLLLQECLELSNRVEIPIILTLRTSNLRRISESGSKGDFVFVDVIKRKIEIKELRSSEEKQNQPEELIYTIEDLLDKRLKFIQDNERQIDITRYFKAITQNFHWNYTFDVYKSHFWEIFNSVVKTFLSEDVYVFCNYNIREVLIFYFRFINKLILDPENRYSFEELFPKDIPARKTLLRNYLYKWIMCSGELVPEDKSIIPNIFDCYNNNEFLLELKILTYLYNTQVNTEGVPFKQFMDDFWCLGYERPILRDTILELTKEQYHNDKTMVWIDQREGKSLENFNLILMPAGKFFLEKLAISRDYVFWTLLCTEFEAEEIKAIFIHELIDYSLTYNDEYKTNVVYNYIEKMLYPKYITDINRISSRFSPPMDWKRTNYEFISEYIYFENTPYIERLIKSVRNSISYSSIDGENKKEEWLNKFDNLYIKVNNTKQGYINGEVITSL